MEIFQPKWFEKKTAIILCLILVTFILKELFLATLFPIFKGQDEARHYNTVQYLAEPEEKTWATDIIREDTLDKSKLDTYRFSEEINKTAISAETEVWRNESYYKSDFTRDYLGKNEEKINARIWQPVNMDLYPDIVSNTNLYHKTASFIEKYFAGENILIRFYLVRIFSLLLGTMVILLVYLIAKNAGFTRTNSIVLAAIVSFQPKFGTYAFNINYDALLIPLFSLFTLGGVLYLKNGLNWKNATILFFSVVLGLLTKGSAIVLFAVLLGLLLFEAYKRNYFQRKNIGKSAILAIFFILLIFIFNQKYSIEKLLPFGSDSPIRIITSLGEYAAKNIFDFQPVSQNYWGTIDWNHDRVFDWAVRFIWIIEFFSAVGLFLYWKIKQFIPWLPEKKFVLFFLAMIASLQIGIHFFDWVSWRHHGETLVGTPGRYFLPNVASHMILVFVGLGMILKKEKYLNYSLIVGLVLMFSLSMYQIFNVILPRFYL